MDEPAAGPARGRRCLSSPPSSASVRDDHDAGVLLIDHNMALVDGASATASTSLDQGRTLAAGTPAEIRAQPRRRRRLPRRDAPSAATCLSRRSSSSDLEVRYGASPPVRGLSLRVDEGEIVGLIGPNGAGKSTTLHAIMGVVPAYAGRASGSRGSSIRRPLAGGDRPPGVALVPEGRRIFAEFTVEENLRLGLGGSCKEAGRRRSRSPRAYGLFPVAAEFRRRPGGRALQAASSSSSRSAGRSSPDPDVLLLDEPSLGLAPLAVDVVFRGAAQDPRARRHDPPGRAARAAHGRARRPHARPRRTASCDMTLTPADADDTDKHRRGLPLVVILGVPRLRRRSSTRSGSAPIYALMAVGIGLVFGVLRLVNFAYGQLVMAGAYTLAPTPSGWPLAASILDLLRRRRSRCSLADGASSVFRPLRGAVAGGDARDDLRDRVPAPGDRADRSTCADGHARRGRRASLTTLAQTDHDRSASRSARSRSSRSASRSSRSLLLALLLLRTTIGLHMRAAAADFRTARAARRTRRTA